MPAKDLKLKTKNLKKEKTDVSDKKSPVKVSKPVVKKAVAGKVAQPVAKKVVSKSATTESVNLSVSVYGLDGKVTGKMQLPAEIFGEKVNKTLLAQAVRVYQANKRQGNASTKTRGEVDGSTRKIYRQKGTGNARHGSLRAPIFVKGGIVHGPKPRDFSLDLPKKMRRKALLSALSSKLAEGQVRIFSGFEKIDAKTKSMTIPLKQMELDRKNSKLLLVTPDNFENVKRASRNISGISSISAQRLNALDVLRNTNLLIAKESISEMEKLFIKK